MRIWGAWLYFGVVASGLILEFATLAWKRRAEP